MEATAARPARPCDVHVDAAHCRGSVFTVRVLGPTVDCSPVVRSCAAARTELAGTFTARL